jgi:REP element-mobilizing transposase RayT
MVIPGAVYHVTKRCAQRQFLATPSGEVNEVFAYCLARAAQRCGIRLHAVVVEANHIHLLLTDPRRKLSEFMRWLDRQVSKCLLEIYAESHPERTLEGIWSKEPFSATLLLTEKAIYDAFVYVLTNPVKDGLVQRSTRWPGLHSTPAQLLGEPIECKRPSRYFRTDKPQYATAQLHFTIPSVLGDRDPEQLVAGLEAMVLRAEQAIVAQMALEGRRFKGVQAILATDPFDFPKSHAPKGKRTPHMAAGGDSQLLVQALGLLREFRKRYRAAFAAYRDGAPCTFPAGTLLMADRFGVQCECDQAIASLALGRYGPVPDAEPPPLAA